MADMAESQAYAASAAHFELLEFSYTVNGQKITQRRDFTGETLS
jgi:hypothetical protein